MELTRAAARFSLLQTGAPGGAPRPRRSLALARRTLGLTAVAFVVTTGTAWGATLSFTGEASRNWNTAANWTDPDDPAVHAVPTAADDIVIPFGAAPQLAAGADGAGRSLALDGGASLTVTGRALSVTGGAPSSLQGQITLTAATLRLAGATTWSGGDWSLDGSSVRNAGDLLISGDVTAAQDGGASLVENTGTITRADDDASAGTASFTTRVVNDGQMDVVSGSAELLGGGVHAGSFTTAADAVLATAGAHALSPGAAVSGDGTLRLDGGTFAVPASAGDFAPGTLLLSGGFLDLAKISTIGRLTSDGEGGGRRGGATLFAGGPTVLEDVTLDSGTTTLSGPEITLRQLSINGATLTLEPGTQTLWDSGSWELLASTIANAGDLLITGDGSATNLGNGAIVRNSGNITRDDADPASGTASFTVGLKNDGTVDVVAGELELAGTAEPSGGTFRAGDGATLSVAATHALERGGEVTGAGTLRLDAGTLAVPPGSGRFDPAQVVLSGGFLSLGRDATVGRLTSDGQGGGRTGVGTLNAGGPTVLDEVVFFGGTTNLSGPAVTLRELIATGSRITLTRSAQAVWDAGNWQLSDAVLTNEGALRITGDGSADDVGDAPLVVNTGTLTRDDADPPAGVATFAARLRNSGVLHVAHGALDLGALGEQDAGLTTLDAGAVLGAAGSRYTVTGGRLEGAGTIVGTLENAGGTVAPGASPGVLAVEGAYTQGPDGTLEAEVAGLQPGTGYDRLAVTGAAALAGTLAIVTPADVVPPLGSVYDVLTAGTLSSTFGAVTGSDLSDRSYEVEYTAAPGRVRLHVPGDAPLPPSGGAPSIPESADSGELVACDPGAWSGEPTAFDVEWLRNGAGIAGATAATYTITDADVGATIRCRVVARNAAGASEAVVSNALVPARAAPGEDAAPPPPPPPSTTSPPLGPGPAVEPEPPANLQRPKVKGTPVKGKTLHCRPGVWSGGVSLTYRWLRAGVRIPGATRPEYRLRRRDIGRAIACRVTARNVAGAVTVTSAAVRRRTGHGA